MFRRALLPFLAVASACAAAPTTHSRDTTHASSSPPPASPAPHSEASASPSPAPPASVLRSAPYHFTFDVPQGWTALTEEQARRVHRDGRFGYSSNDGTAAFVIAILPIPRAMTLDVAADRWAGSLHGDSPHVVAAARSPFDGHEGARVTIESQSNGAPVRTDAVMFLRERHLFALQLVHTPTSPINPDTLFSGFHGTPGEITTSDVDTYVTTAEGPGWRFHDGHYEDAAAGLLADVHDGWGALDRWSTRDLGPDVDIAMRANDLPVYMFMSTEHVPAATQAHWRELLDAQLAHRYPAASGRPPTAYPFDGHPLEMRVATAGTDELLLGSTCRADTCATVVAKYPSSMAADARALLDRSGPTIRWMPARDRAAMSRHLPGSVRDMNIVGSDDAFREGHYTEYVHGVRFALPESGAWQVELGAEAHQIAPNITVSASDRLSDVRLALIIETVTEGTSDEVTHSHLREQFHADPTVHPRERHVGNIRVLESEVVGAEEGAVTYRLVSAVRGTVSVRFEIAGLTPNMAASRHMVDTIARSFEMAPGPIERAHRDGDRYVADQLGYAIRVPGDWSHEQSYVGDGLHADRWSHGETAVFMLVQGPANRPDGVRGADSLIATLNNLDASAVTPDAWRPLTMAGHPALAATWTDAGHGVRGWRIESGRTGYLLFSTDEPAGSAETIAHSVELLH